MTTEDAKLNAWWVDTDPGVDDAWALLMLLHNADLRVVGISVVGGNVGLAHTLLNSCRIIDRSPYPVPIHIGAALPLIGGLPDAGFVHGVDGFGEAELPPAQSQPASLPAALALVEASHRYAGALNVLALGPLTNLALACALDPTLPSRCRRLVVMGGAVGGVGNTRVPSAEFNFAFDPEAAAIVLARWPSIELVDWALTLAAAPPSSAVDAWLAGPSDNAVWLHSITRRTAEHVHGHGYERWPWADPLAALIVAQPSAVLEWSHAAIEIALAPGPTRGQSVVDWHGLGGFSGPSVAIATRVDVALFHAALQAVL